MKRTSREQWEAIIGAWKASGDTATTFSRKRGISVRALRWWRWRLNAIAREEAEVQKSEASRKMVPLNFLEVPVQSIPFHVDGDLLEVVLPSKLVVRVRPGFDDATLDALLNVLERRS